MKNTLIYLFLIGSLLAQGKLLAQDYCSSEHGKDFQYTRSRIAKQLRISSLSCIAQLHQIETVKSLTLNSAKIVNTEPFSYMKSLEALNLSDNAIKDIAPLLTLTKLRSLNLSRNAISNFTIEYDLPSLARLNLDFPKETLSISGLKHLRGIQNLSLKRTGVRSLIPFHQLPRSIVKLDISWNQITDPEDLMELLETMNVNFFPSKRICKHEYMNRSPTIAHICTPYLADKKD